MYKFDFMWISSILYIVYAAAVEILMYYNKQYTWKQTFFFIFSFSRFEQIYMPHMSYSEHSYRPSVDKTNELNKKIIFE